MHFMSHPEPTESHPHSYASCWLPRTAAPQRHPSGIQRSAGRCPSGWQSPCWNSPREPQSHGHLSPPHTGTGRHYWERWEDNTREKHGHPLMNHRSRQRDITVTERCAPQSSQYLKESSTKVVHTLFLMILGIQLWKHVQRVNKLSSHTGCFKFKEAQTPTLLRLETMWLQGVVKPFEWGMLTVAQRSTWWYAWTPRCDFWRGAAVSAPECVHVCRGGM